MQGTDVNTRYDNFVTRIRRFAACAAHAQHDMLGTPPAAPAPGAAVELRRWVRPPTTKRQRCRRCRHKDREKSREIANREKSKIPKNSNAKEKQ